MEIHYRTQHWSLRPVRDMSQEEEEEEEMAENMGVEVGIAVPSLTVEKLFPLPV